MKSKENIIYTCFGIRRKNNILVINEPIILNNHIESIDEDYIKKHNKNEIKEVIIQNGACFILGKNNVSINKIIKKIEILEPKKVSLGKSFYFNDKQKKILIKVNPPQGKPMGHLPHPTLCKIY